MAHGTTSIRPLPPLRFERTPARLRTTVAALLILGLAAMVTAFLVDPARAWRAYAFNWLFWASIAQGAVMLTVVVVLARGIWARSIRRIALAFVGFVPLSVVLAVPPLLFGAEHLFPWIGLDMHGKEVWLNVPFLGVRTVVGLTALAAITLWFAYWQIRPELRRLRDGAPPRLHGLYDRMTRGWRGDAAEEEFAYRRLTVLAPILALVYVVVFSVIAFDWVMSLDWHFFSTMIGGYFFWGAFLGGVAATALAVTIGRGRLGLEDHIEPAQVHDLGKMVFAFATFWAYLYWSQFLVIWYGQFPFTQVFFVERFDPPFGRIMLAALLMVWAIPFFGLLSVQAKRTPKILGTFAVVVLAGLWLERYVLVYPSHYYGAGFLPLSWPEIGTALAFGGLFLGAFTWFAGRFSLTQVWVSARERAMLQTTEERPAEVVTEEYGDNV